MEIKLVQNSLEQKKIVPISILVIFIKLFVSPQLMVYCIIKKGSKSYDLPYVTVTHWSG